ncbi:hypothetical protein RCL1_005045 [Eukaryota sp. TZLM3-RCL]
MGRLLAQKMVSTFKLSSEQLSSQYHYDFGMRAVNTVISAAGNLRRSDPNMPEDQLLLRALRDCNVPKFLADDIPLFNGIISDLFPGIKPLAVDYGSLMKSIEDSVVELGLQPQPDFTMKVIQLWETIVLRHGLMLVGPTGGGKSCCTRVLQTALTKLSGTDPMYQKTKTLILNPKSITSEQLYGGRDKNTQEWFDGVLANCIRKAAEDASPDYNWIICDGPVDAVWIENMNTVLDDNKKLCLNSGEIIPLTPRMRVMFEVEDLSQASPATVSRCGMVYLDPKSTVPTVSLVKSWILTLPSNCQALSDRLYELCTACFDSVSKFVKKNCKELVLAVHSNHVQSCFRILMAIFKKYQPIDELNPTPQEDLDRLPRVIDSVFIFSVIWSFGATILRESHQAFDSFIRDFVSSHALSITLPSDSVFDYLYDDFKNEWILWTDTIPEFGLPDKISFSEMIVPVPESICYQYLIKILAENGSHCLSVGNTGTGKTVQISNLLLKGMDQKYTPTFMNFSAQTSANMTQDIIDSKIERRRAVYYGPPLGTKMVVFIDDLNMPKLEKYGAQPPIELLRQFMDYGGWYDRKDLYLRKLVDVQFICAMGPPGGGRNPVTNRLLRHFNLINFVDLHSKSLNQIFKRILTWFLAKPDFSEEIRAFCQPVVSATVDLYNEVCTKLLPTPVRSHYTFNLRDLSKVIQGVLMAEPKSIDTENSFIRLWTHECCRVFKDRLINDKDRSLFDNIIFDQVNNHFNRDFSTVSDSPRLVFCDFLTSGSDLKKYQEVANISTLIGRVRDFLEDYNLVSQQAMNLVMFQNAVEHVTRIVRILRQPYGNALLLGVGGSGRQSLTRLATFICDYSLFQIEVAKGYGIEAFRDDLKKVLFACGLELKPTVFLFTDAQIVVEEFLEDINNILNSGDVPNIFDTSELDQIYAAMSPIAQGLKVIPTKLNLYSLFKRRVRENIHVVLCMSPLGEAFRARLRMFPSLVNCCTIDWFTEWPDEALQSVAASTFADLKLIERSKSISDSERDLIEAQENDLRKGIVNVCVVIHQSVEKKSLQYKDELRRHNYVTPTSYLELLSTFSALLREKSNELKQGKHRLEVGVNTIIRTSEEVDLLKEKLEKLVPQLKQQSIETDAMIEIINKDKEAAAITRQAVTKEEAEATAKAEEVREVKESAEADLAEAIPVLESARESVQCLKIKSIQEVANYKSPPAGVKLVMQAICVMLGIKPARINDPSGVPGKKIDDYWTPSKALLANARGLMDSLLEYNAQDIHPSIIKSIQPFIDDPNFSPDIIQKVSEACKSMCQWVIAIYKYNVVFKTVEPKRIKLAEATAELAVTEKALAEKKAELKQVEDRIAGLESNLAEKIKTKEELQSSVEISQVKMERASKLLDSLVSEKERWELTVQQFREKEVNLVGDMLISAGYVAYLGAFTAEYREDLANSWKNSLTSLSIPYSSDFSFVSTLGDPVTIRSWLVDGLPTDNLSVENAIIMSKAKRWSVMIDPQGQANRWIRTMCKEIGFDVVKLSDRDFNRKLENGVRFGRAILLENVGEEFPPSLEPLLLRSTFKEGGTEMIKLGDQVIAYHPDFRLYITSKLPNPHYPPETSVKVTLLNFTITMAGLEDQLLTKLVIEEKPELEQMRAKLIKDNAQMAKELRKIEDDMLKVLVETSQDELLENDSAITMLANSKEVASKIKEKVAEAAVTEAEINTTRSQYFPVADRCATLYFCVIDIANIDPMYQYSLQWYLTLFVQGIRNADKNDDLLIRLDNLNNFLTYSLYENICRSLFERHKLLFSFLMTIRIQQKSKLIDPFEWRFLISGGSLANLPRACPGGWVSKEIWSEICNLSQLEFFKELEENFVENLDGFKAIFDANNAHKMPFPDPWQEKLNPFRRLLLVRCIRPDKMIEAVSDYVCETLGRRFVMPPTFDLASSFRDSTPLSPLLFVLSPGADPAADLYDFADKMRMRSKMANISLGQGQGEKAAELIQMAVTQGTWVLLQNCHLASSWMPTLEAIIEQLDPDKVRPEFRLWLTSMPSKTFPVSILQNGVKMTNEPPLGLKSNLLRTLSLFNENDFNTHSKLVPFRKLSFSLAFFHALVQQRKAFGPTAFNIPYEISESDFTISFDTLKTLLADQVEIPWKALRYLTSEVHYGGRFTQEYDRRVLNTIVDRFYRPEILDEGCKFSELDEYFVPKTDSIEDLKEYVHSLPLHDPPQVFGLDSNAAISLYLIETRNLFANIIALQPRHGGGGASGTSPEQLVANLCQQLLETLPPNVDLEQAHPSIFALGEDGFTSALSTTLAHEISKYNRILNVVRNSLKDIIRAIDGVIVMSADLEMVFFSLMNNQVPQMWANIAYPSVKPLSSWVKDLVGRVNFFKNWLVDGEPAVFSLPAFSFPQAFFTSVLQVHARKYKLPIDSLTFQFAFVKDRSEVDLTKDGVYADGLFIESGRWVWDENGSGYIDEPVKGILYSPMPIIHFIPVQTKVVAEDSYSAPLYKTIERRGTLSTTGHSTNFVLAVDLPTKKEKEHWILRGCALLCALGD